MGILLWTALAHPTLPPLACAFTDFRRGQLVACLMTWHSVKCKLVQAKATPTKNRCERTFSCLIHMVLQLVSKTSFVGGHCYLGQVGRGKGLRVNLPPASRRSKQLHCCLAKGTFAWRSRMAYKSGTMAFCADMGQAVPMIRQHNFLPLKKNEIAASI
jgi:hypothetical protein